MITLDGIFAQGYGTIPKAVMHDPELSLESKAIYAYLCALAGSSSVTYPFRSTILRDLGMTKNTYYRHYPPLVKKGYLTVSRPVDKSAANRYTLARRDGGYGFLPKSVMRDPSLSPKAKGLYAYLCAYGGKQGLAFPKRDHILFHLGISEPTYQKALRQLTDAGIVTPVQQVKDGKFAANHYHLGTPQKTAESVSCPCQKNRDTNIRDTKNADALSNTHPANNKFSTTSRSPRAAGGSAERTQKEKEKLAALQNRVEQQPSSLRETLRQTLRAAERLLGMRLETRSVRQQAAAEWLAQLLPDEDRLWQALDAFAAHFRASSENKAIRHKQAYLEAALCNFRPQGGNLAATQRTSLAGSSAQVQHLAATQRGRPAYSAVRVLPPASYDIDEIERHIAAQAVW